MANFALRKNPTIITSSNSPQIIKQLPNTINGRLSHNSSDEAVFNPRKVEYENALKKSSYKVNLKFTTKATATQKKIRQRNIIWLYPPFSRSVKANVENIFFRLLDKHFLRTNRLWKIFNHNTVNVSYRCMKNFVKQ